MHLLFFVFLNTLSILPDCDFSIHPEKYLEKSLKKRQENKPECF